MIESIDTTQVFVMRVQTSQIKLNCLKFVTGSKSDIDFGTASRQVYWGSSGRGKSPVVMGIRLNL
jgi:hypothetical protein